MKKYFLLATVAGCVLAGNAVAGTIAAGSQSAVVNVKAKFTAIKNITAVQDLDFGTLAISKSTVSADGDFVKLATITPAGVLSTDNPDVVISQTTAPSPAIITFSDEAPDISVECNTAGKVNTPAGDDRAIVESGTGTLSDGLFCSYDHGSGYYAVSNVAITNDENKINIGASLYANYVYIDDVINAPLLKVTVKY